MQLNDADWYKIIHKHATKMNAVPKQVNAAFSGRLWDKKLQVWYNSILYTLILTFMFSTQLSLYIPQ